MAKGIPEGFMSLLKSNELDLWLTKIESTPEECIKELHELLSKRQEEYEEEERKKQRRDWTEEEIQRLSKALRKFPPEISNRWTQITEFVRTHTQKEVVAKGQELIKKEELEELEKKMSKIAFEEYKKNMEGISQLDKAKAWTKEEQKALEMALKKFPSSSATVCLPS